MSEEEALSAVPERSERARERALRTASELFYAKGVRAVGMEEIVAQSGVAKTTIYRHFPSKDELVRAFLEHEDAEFWTQWDEVVGRLEGCLALDALCAWIGQRVLRDGYRGCPQINAVAEFSNPGHQAALVARSHKDEMHRRLTVLCTQTGATGAQKVAMQIALLFDGAFTSGGRLAGMDAAALLSDAVSRLLQTDDKEKAATGG